MVVVLLKGWLLRYKALNVCDVNYSQSLRQILDSECDVSDDLDNAYLYSSECDKYDDDLNTLPA